MKPIQHFENYSVTPCGRVYSHKRKQYLKQRFDAGKYKRVTLSKNGKLKTFRVHRLVALTYIPKKESKPHVNHIDGDKTNNHVSNLEWCSQLENNKHARENGLINYAKGENHGNAKKVIDTATGKMYGCLNDASNDLKISLSTIWKNLNGQTKKNNTTLKYI